MSRSVIAAGSAMAVALLLAVAASTTTGDGGFKVRSGLCSAPNEHCINVYLDKNKIEVDVPELYVVGPHHLIYWQIDQVTAPGYTFPNNGIALPSSASSEFPDCHPIQGGKVFFCSDRNTRPGTYKYTINLIGPRPVPALDPTVRNG